MLVFLMIPLVDEEQKIMLYTRRVNELDRYTPVELQALNDVVIDDVAGNVYRVSWVHRSPASGNNPAVYLSCYRQVLPSSFADSVNGWTLADEWTTILFIKINEDMDFNIDEDQPGLLIENNDDDHDDAHEYTSREEEEYEEESDEELEDEEDEDIKADVEHFDKGMEHDHNDHHGPSKE